MAKNIFVVCEQRDNKIQNVSLELLGVANELAAVTKEKVCAVVLGDKIKDAAKELAGYGADIVYVVEDKELKYYLTEQYSQAVYQVLKTYEPNIVLYGATSIGRDLAPRLSARLKTGLTADCTKLEADEEGNPLHDSVPLSEATWFATIVCPDHRPQMSTVRGGVMKKREFDGSRKAEIVDVKINWDKSRFAVSVVEEVLAEKSAESIDDAKFLVSCGRGVKNNLEKVAAFAKSIGATTSSSRALVDSGLMPSEKQVGQTGKTVRPQVYMALGISGAVQHLAGMEESEFIVAINKDKDAPIFKVAQLGVVADANAILPYLEKEIKKLAK